MRDIKGNKALMTELRFMLDHMERKSNELIFRKCIEPRCTHCSSNPVKAVKAWEYLKNRDFKWANPVPSTKYPGHFMTFLEIEELDTVYLKTGNIILQHVCFKDE